MSRRLPCVLTLTFLMPALASAQTSARATFESLAQPNVPSDPLELVPADAQPVQNAEQRAAAVNLLDLAHALSNVRAQAYHLKTTLTVAGSSYDGTWTLDDISPSHGVYRWTAQGPSYSVVNLYTGGMLYSSQPSGGLPLRLAQARAALFFNYAAIGPHALVRTAQASLNGGQLNCVTFERNSRAKPVAGGRRWVDSEYCADAHSGVLATWSPSPGVFSTIIRAPSISMARRFPMASPFPRRAAPLLRPTWKASRTRAALTRRSSSLRVSRKPAWARS